MNKSITNGSGNSSAKTVINNQQIRAAESKVGVLFTSTPIAKTNIMELTFDSDGKLQITIDTDSGYVSHNLESNFDCVVGDFVSNATVPDEKPIYLSEDALLEKPDLVRDEQDDECSIINSSGISAKSVFSGFDDDDDDSSDCSVIIPYNQTITYRPENAINPEAMSGIYNNRNVNNDIDRSQNDNKGKLVLSNVTNICDNNRIRPMPKKVDVKSNSANKENCEPAKTPQKSNTNPLNSDLSPDLFSDDESVYHPGIKSVSPKKNTIQEKYLDKKDVKLLKNVQKGLSGVFPPPSVTIIQLTVGEMLNKIETNKYLFWGGVQRSGSPQRKALLISGGLNESICEPWPKILEKRHHGLHYNRSRISEEFEVLCSKYGQRFVGAETQSSCTTFEPNFTSPSKKKTTKQKWPAKSPGRRLSHLARRRITFSSANLQAASGGSDSTLIGPRTRQILVDSKKLSLLSRRKSPRKTPSKSPFKAKKTTPSSSSKKKSAMHFRILSNENEKMPSTSSENHSRRALFQSPDDKKSNLLSSNFTMSGIYNEKKSTKRALFTSPAKRSPTKSVERKRKRSDSNDSNPAKFPRNISIEIRPTQSELKWNRSISDTSLKLNSTKCEELSDMHKKKLQWAVYESLRMQNITPNHTQFKIFASVLARVTRRFLPSLAAKAPRPEEGTSERMLRIARHHSYAVVKGKSVDEIINEYVRNKMKHQKPHGYVGIEEFNNSQNYGISNKENIIMQERGNNTIVESVEKRKLEMLSKSKNLNDSKIERIRKVISFEDNDR